MLDAVGAGFYKLLWLIMHAKKIILLVILYSICNLLSYYALARVEAAVYTVLLQLKIFTTAAFAVLLLGRNISSAKWRSLFLLVLGCILVASPTFNRCICDFMEKDSASSEEKVPWYESTLGILGVITMVTISGYSSIYFESMLKRVGEKITIWERNFQLAFYSALLLIVIVVWEMKIGHMADIRFFQGWTINTVIVALVQAGGGLLVAATLKYADSILKTLATSGAIVISAVLGNLLLGGVLDIFVSIGCLATILAIFNYTFDS